MIDLDGLTTTARQMMDDILPDMESHPEFFVPISDDPLEIEEARTFVLQHLMSLLITCARQGWSAEEMIRYEVHRMKRIRNYVVDGADIHDEPDA